MKKIVMLFIFGIGIIGIGSCTPALASEMSFSQYIFGDYKPGTFSEWVSYFWDGSDSYFFDPDMVDDYEDSVSDTSYSSYHKKYDERYEPVLDGIRQAQKCLSSEFIDLFQDDSSVFQFDVVKFDEWSSKETYRAYAVGNIGGKNKFVLGGLTLASACSIASIYCSPGGVALSVAGILTYYGNQQFKELVDRKIFNTKTYQMLKKSSKEFVSEYSEEIGVDVWSHSGDLVISELHGVLQNPVDTLMIKAKKVTSKKGNIARARVAQCISSSLLTFGHSIWTRYSESPAKILNVGTEKCTGFSVLNKAIGKELGVKDIRIVRSKSHAFMMFEDNGTRIFMEPQWNYFKTIDEALPLLKENHSSVDESTLKRVAGQLALSEIRSMWKFTESAKAEIPVFKKTVE